MHAKNAELKAGVVVLGALAAFLALLIAATGKGLFGSWRTVHFQVEQGDLAPRKGDTVYVNGVNVGQVEAVRLEFVSARVADLPGPDQEEIRHAPDVEPGATQIRRLYALCTASLRRDQALPWGTWGEISQDITGSRTVNLTLGRSARDLSDEDTRREPIPIRQATGLGGVVKAARDLLERLDLVAIQIQGVMVGAGSLVSETQGLVGDLRAKVGQLDVQGTSDDLRESARTLRRILDGAELQMVEISGNLVEASADVREVGTRGSRIAAQVEADLKELLTTLKQAAAEIDQMLERASPRVDEFLDQMTAVGANLVAVSGDLEGLGPEARSLISGFGRDADELMQTLIDSGQNILDATEDIRANPWKLLSKPGPEEIAYENVRNALQNYVRGMREMNNAASRIRDVLGSGGELDPQERARLQETLQLFESARVRYRAAEDRMMEVLRVTAPPARNPAGPPPRVDRRR